MVIETPDPLKKPEGQDGQEVQGKEGMAKPAVFDFTSIMSGPDGAKLTGHVVKVAGPLTYEEQRRQSEAGGLKVIVPDAGKPPVAYPGPRPDQDKAILMPIMRSAGPIPEMLYKSFLQNYNDRSGENKLPGSVLITELHDGVAKRVKEVQIVGDSEAMQPNAKTGGRVFYPDNGKHPGSAYAILYDEQKLPINVIEYNISSGQPRYHQQWLFNRQVDGTGNQITSIERYTNSKDTTQARPAYENGVMADTYMGTSRYTISQGQIVRAELVGRNGPQVVYDIPNQSVQALDGNSGRLVQAGQAQVPNKLYFTKYFLGM